MKLRHLLFALAFFLPALAHAQGYTHRDFIISSSGRPVAGATITVCTSVGTGTPCTPTATIYTDETLGTPATNPLALCGTSAVNGCRDGRGNYSFSVPFGATYVVTVTGSNITSYSYRLTTSQPTIYSSLSLTEGTGASGAAGQDVLYGKSSTHRLCAKLNNGSEDCLVGAATTDTLTNKTLTSPVVTTPTITGLDLTTASNGNTATRLNYQGTLTPVTGTGAAATYYTYTLPANVLAANKCLRITARTKHSTGTNAANMSLSFGGTSTTVMGDDTTSTSALTDTVYRVCNGASTSAQTMDSTLTRGLAGTIFLRSDTAPVNTTSSVTINAQFSVANTDALTPESFLVELIQ